MMNAKVRPGGTLIHEKILGISTTLIRWASIRSDVSVAGGSTLTEARLDPWLYSVGVRLQF